MKEELHPKFKKSKVTCACGAEYSVLSNVGQTSIGICSQCHPFYTGKQKLVDTEGRVERFRRRYQKNQQEG